jgi:UDP-galactopyranose mutase
MKSYRDLPGYLRGWDVALIPFVKDDATRVVNPPQTLEYLAAGLPVVSTSIQDVVNPYGMRRLVEIADTPAEFSAAIDAALRPGGRASVERAQSLLATMSWDRVFGTMCRIVQQSVRPVAMPVPVLVPSLQPTSHPAA